MQRRLYVGKARIIACVVETCCQEECKDGEHGARTGIPDSTTALANNCSEKSDKDGHNA